MKGIQLPSPAVLQASAIASSDAALGTLLIESGIALAIMALLAAGLGWVIAGRALRPLRAITATAREISASNLHRRLALTGPDDELRQLGLTFDALLERLETRVQRPAPVRGERLARAAHPAHLRAQR